MNWRIAIENLPYIIAVTTSVLMIADFATSYRRGLLQPKQQNAKGKKLRDWVLIFSTIASVLTFFIIIFTFWAPKNAWTLWAQNVHDDFTGCEADHAEKITETYSSGDLAGDCLALSLQENSIPSLPVHVDTVATRQEDSIDNPVLGEFLKYQRAAEELRQYEDISIVMTNKLGLFSNLFVGSGHTLPLISSRSSSGQFQPGLREYLVRNYCIGQNPECSSEGPNLDTAWGWSLDQRDIRLNEEQLTVGEVIRNFEPNLNFDRASTEDWAMRADDIESLINSANRNERVLIRFSQFPETDYQGTVAPAERSYAFFTDASDVWNLTFDEAEIESGRIPDRDPDQNSRVYVWLVVVDAASSTASGLASWDFVFQVLRQPSRDAQERQIAIS